MACVKQAEGKLCPPEPQFQSRAPPPPGGRGVRPACKPHSDAASQPAASPSSEVTGPARPCAAKAQCPPQSGPETEATCQDESPQEGKRAPTLLLLRPGGGQSGGSGWRSTPGAGLPARGLGLGDTRCGEKVRVLGWGGRWAAGREGGCRVRGGAAEVHAPTFPPRPRAWTLTRGGAAAGVVLVQVVLQRVPAASHTHHHVVPEDLQGARVGWRAE